MADILKITLPNGSSYDFKDGTARAGLIGKAEKALYGDTTINVGRLEGSTVGERSTAEGTGTTASGKYSHAEGAGTGATGNYSHAEGCATNSSGDYSHAEGNNSQSNAAFSHAGGFGSYANGASSFAHGEGVVANNDYETAFGKGNLSSSNTIFSIGNGTVNARHNAFEITTTGGKLHDKEISTTQIDSTTVTVTTDENSNAPLWNVSDDRIPISAYSTLNSDIVCTPFVAANGLWYVTVDNVWTHDKIASTSLTFTVNYIRK